MRGSTVWPQNESSQILSVPLVFFYQLSIDFVVDFNGLDGCEKSTIDEKLSWMKCNRNTIGETNWLFSGFEILFCTILEIRLLWFVFLLFARILECFGYISLWRSFLWKLLCGHGPWGQDSGLWGLKNPFLKATWRYTLELSEINSIEYFQSPWTSSSFVQLILKLI